MSWKIRNFVFHAFAGARNSVAHFWLFALACWMIYWPPLRVRVLGDRCARLCACRRARCMAQCSRANKTNSTQPILSPRSDRMRAHGAPLAWLGLAAPAQAGEKLHYTFHAVGSIFRARAVTDPPHHRHHRHRTAVDVIPPGAPALEVN